MVNTDSLIARVKRTNSLLLTKINSFLSTNKNQSGFFSGEELSTCGNPILTAEDVTDYGSVSFIADPFLYINGNVWHLFFEVQNGYRKPTAVIGHATSKDQGDTWQYNEVVLEWERHLAFPFIFESNNEIYMLPGQGGDALKRTVTLFKATSFPNDWQPVADLISPNYGPLDPIIFQHEGWWWIIVGGGNNDCLYVYYSSDLKSGKWTAHPKNPVVSDRVCAGRPAGRPLSTEGGVIIFLQDNRDQYGNKVRAYKITKLTPKQYTDKPINNEAWLEGTGRFGWNSGRMHHTDIQYTEDNGWICITDGDMKIGHSIARSCWSIGGYKLDNSSINNLGL